MQKEIRKVFCYGTLKPGHDYVEWNEWIHDHASKSPKFLTKSQPAILNDYQLYLAEYPLVLPEKGQKVEGYVLTVNDSLWPEFLKICDEIEEYPQYYDKKILEVEICEENVDSIKSIVEAIVYTMREDRYEINKIKKLGTSFKKEDYENDIKVYS